MQSTHRIRRAGQYGGEADHDFVGFGAIQPDVLGDRSGIELGEGSGYEDVERCADRARDGVVVEDVHVAGRQAQVVTADDTLFLAVSGDAWVVTAAGCTPREDRPYDCEVEA